MTPGNDSEFWEPWIPLVGQHVRVRLSGECRWRADRIHRAAYHWPALEQREGLVKRVDVGTTPSTPSERQNGHRFLVEFAPVAYVGESDGPIFCQSQCFAALELEPA